MRTKLFLILAKLSFLLGANQAVHAQITLDSMQRKALEVINSDNRAKLVETLMEFQTIFLNDSLTLFLEQNIGMLKKVFGDTSIQYRNALAALGTSNFWKGEYQYAIRFLLQAADIFKIVKKEGDPVYATILNSLAKVYARIGDAEKAFAYCRQAKEIREKTLKKTDKWYVLYPISLDDLAALYLEKAKYDSAFSLYQESLQIRREIYDIGHPYYAIGLSNMGNFYAAKHEFQKALSYQTQALETYKTAFGEDDIEYNLALEQVGALYQAMGWKNKALPILQQVAAWRAKKFGENHPLYAQCLTRIALLTDDPMESSQLFCRANRIFLVHLHTTYASLSEQEKIAYELHSADQFHYLPSLLHIYKINQPQIINQVFENELAVKGMVLEDQKQVLQDIRQKGNNTTLSLYKQWRYNKALYGKIMLTPNLQKLMKIDSLLDLVNREEQRLSNEAIGFRKLQFAQGISLQTISQKLARGEAAIEFVRYRLYKNGWTDSILYAAMILLPNDTTAKFISLFEEKELLKILKGRSGTNASIFKLYPSDGLTANIPACSMLYKLIWAPLQRQLKNVKTIYLAPAGLLDGISFQALRKDNNHLLIDLYRVNQVLSTRSVALTGNDTGKLTTASIWGNIQYNVHPEKLTAFNQTVATTDTSFIFYTDVTRGTGRNGEWRPLPGTKQEVDNIRKIFKKAGVNSSLATGAAATEKAFKSFDGNSPQVLHLATHGFFLPVVKAKTRTAFEARENTFTIQQNPMFRSGLVLAGGNLAWTGKSSLPGREDGILTAYEISQMDLSRTDLVVLSACETALGDLQGDEGVIGLQRAFKLTGVKQLIMSLWRVPDKETSELMTLFYKNWLNGQTTREALRKAQLSMRKKYPPYSWAGFVMVE